MLKFGVKCHEIIISGAGVGVGIAISIIFDNGVGVGHSVTVGHVTEDLELDSADFRMLESETARRPGIHLSV